MTTNHITIDSAVVEQALEALNESVDLVQLDYDTDWRHGLPTRKAQLDISLELLNAHKNAITALRAALEQSSNTCRLNELGSDAAEKALVSFENTLSNMENRNEALLQIPAPLDSLRHHRSP